MDDSLAESQMLALQGSNSNSLLHIIGVASSCLALYGTIYLIVEPFPALFHSLHMSLHLFAYLRPRLAMQNFTKRNLSFHVQLIAWDIYYVWYTTMYFARALCLIGAGDLVCQYRASVTNAFSTVDKMLNLDSQILQRLCAFGIPVVHPTLQLLHGLVIIAAYASCPRSGSIKGNSCKRQPERIQVLIGALFLLWLFVGLVEFGQ